MTKTFTDDETGERFEMMGGWKAKEDLLQWFSIRALPEIPQKSELEKWMDTQQKATNPVAKIAREYLEIGFMKAIEVIKEDSLTSEYGVNVLKKFAGVK